jgi:hypothetical protein
MHDLFWIIPDPGSQKTQTLSLISSTTIPFQARTSDVTIAKWGQHCSGSGMPHLASIFGTFWWTGVQPNENPGKQFRCTADIFSNMTDHEIQQPGTLVVRNISQVGLVGCTNDRHNHRFSMKLNFCV